MRAHRRLCLSALVAISAASPVAAQQRVASADLARDAQVAAEASDSVRTDTLVPASVKRASLLRRIEIQHIRPLDQRGLNVFETPKEAGVAFDGFKLSFGAAFTQQMQGLNHANAADSVPTSPTNSTNANRLMDIGTGFNNATANLYLNAQLAPGVRVALTTYLSSRRHNETWVKDGYILIDESPIDFVPLQALMQYVTLKIGHMEINYGDAHFRRTDNGNALYNPFVGNYILDAFTTEVGGEVYVRGGGLMAMGAITNGEIRGNTTQPGARKPSFIGKLGVDRQLTSDLRVRLTGSAYRTESSINNTLYAGDRAGSRYYNVMENTQATESGQATSGLLNPGFRDEVTAYMVNPFVKFRRLELFGLIEQAEGRAANETANRDWSQYALDAVYRFLPGEQAFVGARYNTVEGRLAGQAGDVGADRTALAAGWFLTPNVLLKGEWVTQKYRDFPTTDIRRGGKFDGFIVEGVVAF
jgi:hypothetical protein